MPAVVRSVQVTGDVMSQQSKGGAVARQEREEDVAEVASGLGGSVIPSTAEAATVTAPSHAGDGGMARMEEMIEKLKVKNLALHG